MLLKQHTKILHALEVSTHVIIVQVALLNLVGHLPLAFSGFLGVLQLESVLVHGETHSL